MIMDAQQEALSCCWVCSSSPVSTPLVQPLEFTFHSAGLAFTFQATPRHDCIKPTFCTWAKALAANSLFKSPFLNFLGGGGKGGRGSKATTGNSALPETVGVRAQRSCMCFVLLRVVLDNYFLSPFRKPRAGCSVFCLWSVHWTRLDPAGPGTKGVLPNWL